jgi:nicotinamidase-related amidase
MWRVGRRELEGWVSSEVRGHGVRLRGKGAPFDVRAHIGAIADAVVPRPGETVIVKSYPNSFVDTELDGRLQACGSANLVLAGFMTHMCLNSTARGAFELGYMPTVVAAATATRPLSVTREVVSAASLQVANLAALADLFAVVVPDSSAIPS